MGKMKIVPKNKTGEKSDNTFMNNVIPFPQEKKAKLGPVGLGLLIFMIFEHIALLLHFWN